MPTGVAQVVVCHTLPLHFSALRRDRNGGSTEEIGSCEDSQEVHLADHNRRNSASYDGLSSLLQFVLQFTDSKVFRHFRHPWAVVLSLVQAQTL
jgi:hypothetical protein